MILIDKNCVCKKCKHFKGVNQPHGDETVEYYFCEAFPNGIPGKILMGENKHKKPLKDQKNDIVYEEYES